MLNYFRSEWQFMMIGLSWALVSTFLGPFIFLYLPLTLLLLKAKDQWPELLFGFVLVLVFSDMNKEVMGMRHFKQVKNLIVLLLTAIFLLERWRFAPFSRVFAIFLPFFLYSIFPLVYSSTIAIGVQKTLSYALMFLIVPNYVLYNYRTWGWPFFRNLLFFMGTILLVGLVMVRLTPDVAINNGRVNGLFGNPNGLAIFSFLVFLLLGLVSGINRRLFSRVELIVLYGLIIYSIIASGSRGALASVLIFVLFNRFFSRSPFLGFITLLVVFAVSESIISNLPVIIMALGLEEYFRLHTLEEGSGRYFAWQFGWQQLQQYFFFGGGFGNDEFVMRRNYDYLMRMGHQGGLHNSYLSLWFNVGIVGLLLYFRSFILLFFKAAKLLPMSLAAMFAVLFSVMYESWLVGSLNPFTIILLMIMTVCSEEEIALWTPEEEESEVQEEVPALA